MYSVYPRAVIINKLHKNLSCFSATEVKIVSYFDKFLRLSKITSSFICKKRIYIIFQCNGKRCVLLKCILKALNNKQL